MKINITENLTFNALVDLEKTPFSNIIEGLNDSPMEMVIESSNRGLRTYITMPTWLKGKVDGLAPSNKVGFEEGVEFFECEIGTPYFLPLYTSLGGEFLDSLNGLNLEDSDRVYTIWRIQRNNMWGKKALDMYYSYLNGNDYPAYNNWGRVIQDYILSKLNSLTNLIIDSDVKERGDFKDIEDKIVGTGFNFHLCVGVYTTNPDLIRKKEIVQEYQSILSKYDYHNYLSINTTPIKHSMALKSLNKGIHEFKLPTSIISQHELISLLGGVKEDIEGADRDIEIEKEKDNSVSGVLDILPYIERDLTDVSWDRGSIVGEVAESLKRVGLVSTARLYNETVEVGVRLTVIQFSIPKNKTITQIQSKQRDIQASLGVKSLGIQQGNLPDTVKLIIPNEEQTLISLRELMNDDSYYKFKKDNSLSFIAGVDETNNPIYLSLSKLVHLLVAGTTGSGKSVFLNAVITSLVTSYNPKELNLYMIDPKEVELQHYEGFPHTERVITDMKEACEVLHYLTREMDSRYALFKERKVKNIEIYNEKYKDTMSMPYIVCVVDEYADLKDLFPEVEDYIGRLGQKARASGIHLIIATQRPSTDIISGRVKAVIPNAISFNLNNHNNYRTVFGTGIPYSSLLGKGDGVMKIEGSLVEFQRFQSPIVVPDESLEGEVYYELSNYLSNKYKGTPNNNKYVSSSLQKSSLHLDEDSDLDRLKKIIANTGETRVAPLRQELSIKTSLMPGLMSRLVEEGWLIKHASKSKG